MKKELFSKLWYLNTSKSAEAIVLLDIVQIIYSKSICMQYRSVKMTMDNKKVQQITHRSAKVVNYYNQDVATEALVIERIINNGKINTIIKKFDMHKATKKTFDQDLGTYIVKIHDKRAKEV